MKSIRVRNLRSFYDSGDIQLNKLNILLGENSSGKSSFIRIFPMLKNTVNHELRGPISWFDDSYDFGDFAVALNRKASVETDTIDFHFTWKPLCKKTSAECADCPFVNLTNLGIFNASDYSVLLRIGSHHGKSFYKEVRLNTPQNSFSILDVGQEELTLLINEQQFAFPRVKWNYSVKGILPDLEYIEQNSLGRQDRINSILNQLIPDILDAKIKASDFMKLFSCKSLDFNAWYKHATSKRHSIGKTLSSVLKKESDIARELYEIIILNNVEYALRYIDRYISTTFRETNYITPIRYSIGRYIRNKYLSVDTIDPAGTNVMEYILSLDDDKFQEYSNFLRRTIGISASISKTDSPNKEILITDTIGEVYNIVDMGYGLTQILPIATILWDKAHQTTKCEFANIISIEQPEVHLHPKMQGNVATLLVEALQLSKKKKGNLKIIIETHSSIIINRIGRYVRNGTKNPSTKEPTISSDDICINLFNKNDGITTIKQTKYDENGRILEWPIGFLD